MLLIEWIRGSHEPFLLFPNLLEWLTESREMFYLLDYCFIIKGYNSGMDRWKRCKGNGMGKGHEASMSSQSMPLSLNLHVFNNPKAFPAPIFLFLIYFISFIFKIFKFIFLYNRFLLVIYFIHISVYMSIPISQFIPPPPPPPTSFPPWGPYICPLHLCLYFCPANRFICTIFLGSTYMR